MNNTLIPESEPYDDIERYTDFLKCVWTPESDPENSKCEKCGGLKQLYFGNTDYWSNDGDYWCADCILETLNQVKEITPDNYYG